MMETLLFAIDWNALFVPDVSLVELIFRGSVMYLVIFILMRVLRRQAGGLSITDVLLVVLIAEAASNGLMNDYKSLTAGVVLVGTIAFWNYFLEWLAFRFPKIRWILEPQPLQLIKDGRILRKNLQKELMTEEELMSQLREQGIENVSEVKKSYIEGDGRISIIKKENTGSINQGNNSIKKQDIMH